MLGPIAVYLLLGAVFFNAGSFDGMEVCEPGGDEGGHRLLLRSAGAAGGGGGGYWAFGGGGGGESYRGLSASSYGSSYGPGHDDDAGHGDTCAPVSLAMVLSGWGVPTATDISLAWMVAVLVFGLGHNAIGFLLLLAVVDDGIGLVIIAVAYPDPLNPVQPQWLPLIPAGALVAYALRR